MPRQNAVMPLPDRQSGSRPSPPAREKRMPVFMVRALAPDGRNWTTIGVAFERKHGQEGYALKLNALPLSGVVVLLPPLPDEDVPEEEFDPETGEVR